MESVEMIVSGVVQCVGFRYYTQITANKLGIEGYVKNEYDGTVRIVATGENSAMIKFIDWVKVGPPSATVTNVNIKELDESLNLKGFKVKY